MSPLSVQDVMAFNSEEASALPFPIIADAKRELSVQLGMLDPDERDKDGMPLTARCVRHLLSFFTLAHYWPLHQHILSYINPKTKAEKCVLWMYLSPE